MDRNAKLQEGARLNIVVTRAGTPEEYISVMKAWEPPEAEMQQRKQLPKALNLEESCERFWWTHLEQAQYGA